MISEGIWQVAKPCTLPTELQYFTTVREHGPLALDLIKRQKDYLRPWSLNNFYILKQAQLKGSFTFYKSRVILPLIPHHQGLAMAPPFSSRFSSSFHPCRCRLYAFRRLGKKGMKEGRDQVGQASAWRLAWPKECHEDRTAQVVGPRRDQLDL